MNLILEILGANLDLLKENPVASSVVLVCLLIDVAIKVATGVINFHEELSVQRHLKRLRALTDDIDKDSLEYKYVKALSGNEIFRIASGVDSYPEHADILMQIYLCGVASKRDLKRLSIYLLPRNKQVSIRVGDGDKFLFAYSLFCSFMILILSFYVALWNFITGSWIHFFAAVVIGLFMVGIGMFLGRDYKTWRILKRVRERLIELDMVANPDDSIEWNTLLCHKDAASLTTPLPPDSSPPSSDALAAQSGSCL